MNRYLKPFLITFLCLLCINVQSPQNMVDSAIPQSQTTYTLHLDINSPYYTLSNIEIQIYDGTTLRWNTANPYSITLFNQIYRLKIYNLDEALLFEDGEDVTWTSDYRTIKLDQLVKITNNYPYPVSITYTRYNTVYERLELYPIADITTQWSRNPASGGHYDKIDESVLSLTDYIYDGAAPPITDSFSFTQIGDIYDYFIVNSFNVNFYGDLSSGSTTLNVDYYLGSWTTHVVTMGPDPTGYTYGVYDQSLSRTQINAINLRFVTVTGTGSPLYYIYQCNLTLNTFHSENEVSDTIQLNPYDSTVIQALVANTLTISDLYGEVLESGTYSAGEHIILTPDEQEQCIIQYVDQNNHALDFNQFITWVNTSLVTDPNLIATRATHVEVITCNLDNITIETNTFLINNSLNYLTIPIDTLYLTNNAPEPVNMSFVENGHYNGVYSWDLDTPNTRPSDITEYGNEGLVYLQNEAEGHNKVMYLNSTVSNQYGYNDDQFDSALTGWTFAVAEGGGATGDNYAEWVASYQSRQNTCKIVDTSTKTSRLYNTAITDVTSVFISFNFMITSGIYAMFQVLQGSTIKCYFKYSSGDFQIYRDGPTYTTVGTGTTNVWYHICLYLDSETDTVKIWIDELYKGKYILHTTGTGYDQQFYETGSTSNATYYIDTYYWSDSLSEAFLSYNASSYITFDSTQEVYATEFDAGLSGWGSWDGTGCDSTYLASKTLDFTISNVLREYDNSSSAYCRMSKTGISTTIFSWWMGSSDVSLFSVTRFYEGANHVGSIFFWGDKLYFNTVSGVEICSVSDNTWYHLVLVIKPTTDKCDIYVNGVKIKSNLALAGVCATSITIWHIDTNTANTGYYAYWASPYFGSSLSEALASYHDAESIEWWQKQTNCTGMQFGETIVNFADTIFYFNDSTLIYNQDQMTNEWTHYRLEINGFSATLYRNLIELATFDRVSLGLDTIAFFTFGDCELCVDAVDYSWANAYILNRNYAVNSSADLWCWDAFPNWNSGYYSGHEDNLADWTDNSVGTSSISIVSIDGHNNAYCMDDQSNPEYIISYNMFEETQIQGIIEFWCRTNDKTAPNYITIRSGSTDAFYIYTGTGANWMYWNDTATASSGVPITNNMWYHFKFVFDCSLGTKGLYSLYIDDTLINSNIKFRYVVSSVNRFRIQSWTTNMNKFYLDGVKYSWDSDYFQQCSTLENTTYSPLPMAIAFSQQVNPYSSIISNYTIANYLVGISDLYNNLLDVQGLEATENELIYIPNENRQCFISVSDQRGQYLDWENYKIYLNNTLIYRNYFNAELNSIWNITVKDRFNYQMTSTLHTVDRDENYIALTLTLYSLKIYNQQETYIYSNLTRTGTSQYWTEWVAPGEYISYRLVAGNYAFNITEYETSSSTVYGYTLSGDDYLLIMSSNTLYNVLQNIANVNSTVGNQITSVEINLSNQNSQINNTIIDIYISVNSTNSSLTNLLINQQNDITALLSNMSVVLLNQQNNFAAFNSSFQNMAFFMAQNFTFVQSQINNTYLEMLTQFLYVNSNISSSSVNIINNILAINSSISGLITTLQSNVFLVNDSIYTAVLNVSTALSISNTTILGNLSIIFQQNEFLTEIFKKTMFSDLLFDSINWTGIGYNYTLLTGMIDTYQFVNQYRNETVELLLKYQNQIHSELVGKEWAMNLPNTGVTFRVRSVATGEYLSDWKALPSNKTVPLGFYEETVPTIPETIETTLDNYLLVAMFVTIALVVISVLFIKAKSNLPNEFRKRTIRRNSLISLPTDTELPELNSIQKKNRNSAILVICFIIIAVFILCMVII